MQAYEYDLIVIGGGSGGLAAAKVRLVLPVFCLWRDIYLSRSFVAVTVRCWLQKIG